MGSSNGNRKTSFSPPQGDALYLTINYDIKMFYTLDNGLKIYDTKR